MRVAIAFVGVLGLLAGSSSGEVRGAKGRSDPRAPLGDPYLLDNSGNWIIIKPGERFVQVGRNQIVHMLEGRRQEQTIGTPVFEGKRIYYRGAEYLYCIGGP